MICTSCGNAMQIGGWPFCPDHGRPSYTNVTDEIPGGMLIENLGPTPIRVYSHSERLRIAKERGLQEVIRHVPLPGSDKSPHTRSWATMDPYTLENARILAERQATTRVRDTTTDSPEFRRAEACLADAELRLGGR